MKTVTGKIVSSSPASISTASSILTKFVSTENGASQAVNAYLRRATAAFDELVRIHSKSDRKKHRKDKSDGVMQSLEVSQEPGHDEIGSGKKEKKKKEGSGDSTVKGDDKSMMVSEVKEESNLLEEKKKKRKDKQKDERSDFGDFDGVKTEVYVKEDKNDVNEHNLVEENESKKHKKKKKKRESSDAQKNEVENGVGEGGDETVIKKEEKGEIGIENEGEVGIDVGKEERKKKRKNREVDVVESGDGSEEPRSKKTKRRRSREGEN